MKKYTLFILCLFVGTRLFSQITVTGNNVAAQLANKLVGYGVTISNPTLDCGSVNTTDYGSGIFTTVTSNLGLDSGIVLTSGVAATSGTATGVNGPVGSFASNVPNWPGDPDLNLLINGTTYDRCVLEFDFTTIGDTVKFNYVFGSEEYQSWTCTTFNDVFGFFLSGPGVTGPYSNSSKNLALVPGSTTCPVAISTIFCPNSAGCCNTTQYCFGNTPGCGAYNAANNTCAYFVCNGATAPGTVTYQGFTVPLTAVNPVIPCSTYHIKMAVADKSDHILDSGFFLQAGSFSSNQVNIDLNTGLTSQNGNPVIVEGCDTTNKLIISRQIVGTAVYVDTINFLIQGNATNGVDYSTLPSSVVFTAGGLSTDTLIKIPLIAFNDGIAEGTEYIKIYILSGCMSLVTDSIIVEIRDSLSFNLTTPNTALCLGQSVTTAGTWDNGLTFQWSPTTNMTNPNGLVTTITPTAIGSQTYSLTATYMTCTPVTQSFTVTTDPIPVITPISDYDLCEGNDINISVTVNPPFNYNYSWNPATNISNQNGSSATLTGVQTQNVTFTATSPNAGCTASDDFQVNVWPWMQGTICPDTLVCNAQPVQLWVTGGSGNYMWYPSGTLSCSLCPDPIATALGTTIYYAVLLDPHGCQDTLKTIVENHPPFSLVLANNDTTIFIGESVELFASGAPYYYWSPTNYMTYTQGNNPMVTPIETTTYVVTGVSTLQGCPQKDSVTINVVESDVWVPSVFSPNNDGKNDLFHVMIGRNKLAKLQEFKIYDRWGKEIFATKDILDGWDGKYKGTESDPGVYFYQIRIAYPTGRTAYLKGDVTLIR